MNRSATIFFVVTLFLGCLWGALLHAEVQTETIEYGDGGVSLQGYLAYDEAQIDGDDLSSVPGILIVHQWMGLTDYERGRAEQLAEMGYVAFALDIYGTANQPENRGEAGKQAGKFKGNRKLYRRRLLKGLETFKERTGHDDDRIAAIGYCFGGTGVLELARTGTPIAGVVSFHGGLDSPTPEDGKAIRARVLVCHGAADPHVPQKEIQAFQKEMEAGGVDWQMIIYGHAVHAFTQPMAGDDPSKGAAYDEKADRRSWAHMQLFFDELW